jgi:CheY-like chemotaxis protein
MTRKHRLLVVDDNESILHYLQVKLGARYDIVTSNSSEQVLALARAQRPDVIVCDLDMPGMDGGDVSAALFADDATRDIPVLFLSVLVNTEQQLGGRHAISKSAPLGELVARIESLLKP